jgi:beta-galactosidase
MRIDGMISATDVYPILIGEGNFHQLLMVNEATKALHNKRQALFSIEFQSGGVDDFSNGQSSFFDLHTRLCLSSGMRAINHYLFFSGENDPILSPTKRHDWGHPVRTDGTLRRHYYRYPKLAKVLNSYGTDLTIARPQTVATVGFLLDYFMTEVNNEYTRKFTDVITHQRDVVLFDMIARGLSLTHRPFNAIELSSGELNVTETPVCWVMMEKQCNAETQRKLVDYLNNGGKLILAGRMCVEDFAHQECTILRDAVGIREIFSDAPFVQRSINAFNYRDIPVSFVETYTGTFDETFAWLDNGDVVGFTKSVGKGKVMLFGAAMIPVTLEDVDVVHLMGLKMDCPALFKLDHWADVRINLGKNGSFLFINNYQDDPLETKIEYEQAALLDGNPVRIPARQGMILPIEWRINQDILIHYVTAEIIDINSDGDKITITMAQDDFFAEITNSGYVCEEPGTASIEGSTIKVQGKEGKIVLVKNK